MRNLNSSKQENIGLPSVISLREEVSETDRESLRHVLESSGCFYPFEMDTAISLYDERLSKGVLSGYNFLIANKQNVMLGYSCYGPIPCTQSNYDLYWIAIDQLFRHRGLGTYLMNETEKRVKAAGGINIYIETSSRDLYNAARYLYTKCGYKIEAIFTDFYAIGDDKIVYKKNLTNSPQPTLDN